MDREQASNILGINKNAPEDEIKDRFQELTQKNHPDKGGSAELFKQIKEARDVLLNKTSEDSDTSNTKQRKTDSTSSDLGQEYGQQQVDPENTYDLGEMSDIALEKIVRNSMGQIVTINRLTKKQPGMSHPQTLTDSPLIEYIHKMEQPHFTLRFNKVTIGEQTMTPENGGFLVLTDARILLIIGTESGDEQFTIPYQDVEGVNSRGALLSSRHKFIIESTEGVCRFKIDHNTISESQVSGQEELDLEIEAAEQFIREAAYQYV
jgi:hypothetical protein